jgi:hypothetical protein
MIGRAQPTPQPEPEEEPIMDEQLQICVWRQERLEGVGVPRGDAFRIAQSAADLHTALKMFAQGCSSALLVDILT